MFLKFYFQVDIDVQKSMTEEQLSHFFPKFGDQVAVKAFCHLQRSETSRITEVQRPVDSSRILQRLRERVKSKVMAQKQVLAIPMPKRVLPRYLGLRFRCLHYIVCKICVILKICSKVKFVLYNCYQVYMFILRWHSYHLCSKVDIVLKTCF